MGPQATILGMGRNTPTIKVMPASRLVHRYGEVCKPLRLGADEIGEALIRAGFIEWVQFGPEGLPTKFRETILFRSISPDERASTAADAIRNYFGHK